jgi:oxygen-independent coproporphyrinogen-3 oxidase
MIEKLFCLMLKKKLSKISYHFTGLPEIHVSDAFGVYVNIPLCIQRCSFCAFYSERFSAYNESDYTAAVIQDIELCKPTGHARWVYFGGGTPNCLSLASLNGIITCLKKHITASYYAIELLPSLLTEEYLNGLRRMGFSKISMGIESFAAESLKKTGRKNAPSSFISDLVEHARSIGLWTSLDFMIGLPGQTALSLAYDVAEIERIAPDQVALYPIVQVKGKRVPFTPSFSSMEQFEHIERISTRLAERGYIRKTAWILSRNAGSEVYDSSGNELAIEYIGFGAGAYSAYGSARMMNPEIPAYLQTMADGKRMGFVSTGSGSNKHMRTLSKMIYDLDIEASGRLPWHLRTFAACLNLCGYSTKGRFTTKGRFLSHQISKTAMESLPFPIQYPGCVKNAEAYEAYKSRCTMSNKDFQPYTLSATGGRRGI